MATIPASKRFLLSLPVRLRVQRMTNGRCWYCGEPTFGMKAPNRSSHFTDYQVDHIVPVSKGGTNAYANLVPACRECNLRKWTYSIEVFRVYRWANQNGHFIQPSEVESLVELMRPWVDLYEVAEAEHKFWAERHAGEITEVNEHTPPIEMAS